MSCATDPIFWQRQRRLPLPMTRFLRALLEEALREPSQRGLLVWPTILGAPRLRKLHPEGIPETELLAQSRRMLEAFGVQDPALAFREALQCHPQIAIQGATGWLPDATWEALASELSLRSGVMLVALTGQPEDERYRLSCGVALFNMALFHECHDALEALWLGASGDLKEGLQGLILMSAGFYHQQHHDAAGMLALWRDGLPMLERFGPRLETPWGTVDFRDSLTTALSRLDWLMSEDDGVNLEKLWGMPRPEWSLT